MKSSAHRLIAGLAACSAAALGLAATSSASTAPTQPAAPAGPVVHWQHHSDAREKVVKDLIAEYGKDGGGPIEFESIPYSDYFTRLGAALEAGNGPCVFQLPANILAEYQARGQLAPLPADVMSAADVESTFTPASIALLKIGGEYYGLPTDLQTLMLMYNDDLFTEAGLDPTKDFATWDEFRDAAIKLTKRDGDTFTQAGVDIASSPYQWYYSVLPLAFKGGLVDDTTGKVAYASDPGYQVWQRITDLVTTDKVDSPEFLAEQSKFGAGMAAMTMREYTFVGVYKLSAPDVKLSVHVPPPASDSPSGSVATTSWAYAVSADCADKASAWAWVSYLTSEKSQRTWIAEGGELPSRLSILSDPAVLADPNAKTAIDALANAVPYDSNGWDDVFTIQQAIWDEIVLNGTPVKDAVDKGAAAEDALYVSKGLIK